MNEIIINGTKYTYEENELGEKTLMRYNSKHNMWVKLHFCNVTQKNSIIETLTAQYINSYAGAC